MSRFWSQHVHDLQPYVPGEQPKVDNLIKLNTNENPYPPSPKVLERLSQQLDQRLRLYPDPDATELKKTIADYYDVDPSYVFVGNGSDEVLAHIFNGLLQQQAPILFPDITYSFYPVYCRLYQIDYQLIALTDEFEINVNDYQQVNGGIIFPNPDAPTSRFLALEQIEKLLQFNTESVVVVDEAYVDFGGQTAIELIEHYPNLLVTQSLSKSRSLAAMRIGLAVGQPELIQALVRVKDSFNSYPMSTLAIQAGVAAFDDQAYFEQTCAQVIASRQQLQLSLEAMGFEVLPSAANFVFVRHSSQHGEALAKQLREHNIIVRHFNHPRINSFLRITIGTPEQNQQLLNVLHRLV